MSTTSAHETVRKNKLKSDDKFVYYVELPTLQEIASYRVCQSIWYSYVSSPTYILTPNLWMRELLLYLGAKTTYQKDIDELIEDLRHPHRIEEILKIGAKKILAELTDWTRHLYGGFFPDCLGECSFLQIDSSWCVWMANGEIDYRKSAQMMLDSGGLTDVQKFVVASKYCMEDEIKTVSLESLPECVDKVTYENDCVLFYWICYAKNELQKLPFGESASVDVEMARQCYGDKRVAFEYFWRRSLHDDTHLYTCLIVYNCEDARTWSILERAFAAVDSNSPAPYCVERKLIMCSMYSKSSRYPLWLWNRCKRLISDEHFEELVLKMLHSCIHIEEKMMLLTRIWDTADDHHRNYTLQNSARRIVWNFHIYRGFYIPCATAVQFLRNYYSLLSPHERRNFFNFDDAPGLFTCVQDVHFLDEMFELCPVDSDALSQLKHFTRTRKELLTLGETSIISGNFERINVTVDWLVSNKGSDAVRGLKIYILQHACRKSDKVRYESTFLIDFEKWNRLCSFIDETYAEDTLPALNLKRYFVQSLIKRHNFDLRFRDAFDSVKKVVESVFSSAKLDACKRQLFRLFCAKLKKHEYWWQEEYCDERFFENFIDWYCGNDRVKISQFKNRVPHGALISAVLDRLTQGSVYEFQRPVLAGILLDRLQKYLIWYLGSEHSVNEYKLRRINDTTTDLTFLKIISEKKNESCLMVILRWFFNGDETNVNEFMLKNSALLNM